MPFEYYKKSVLDRDINTRTVEQQSENPFLPGYKHKRKDYYPPEFYKIRNEVMKRFDERCFICDEISNEIHHIDYNRENNDINNLMLLCKYHHAKTNFNRKYWEQHLSKQMKEKFTNRRNE